MIRFFDSVAQTVVSAFDGNMLNLHFVFPNRRGGVYFSRSLNKYANGRVMMPYIETMSDVCQAISGLKPANDMQLLLALYHASEKYDKRNNKENGNFWGRADVLLENMMLWDQYNVDVTNMLRECLNWDKLESRDFLNDEQKKAIEQYWGIEIDRLDTTRNPEEWWNRILFLYNEQRRMMSEMGYGDDGMIARDALNKIKSNTANIEGQMFMFIGFNELTGCTKEIMRELKSRNKAIFFWDYDGFITQQASGPVDLEEYVFKFRNANLQLFPDYRKSHGYNIDQHIDNTPPKLHQIGVNSHYGVNVIATKILEDISSADSDLTGTCLMLTHPDDLKKLVVGLPKGMQANITMQLQMRTTNVMAWLEAWFNTIDARQIIHGENAFYHLPLQGLLLNPLTKAIDDKACENTVEFIRQNSQVVPLYKDIENIIGKDNDIALLLAAIISIQDGRGMLSLLRKWLNIILQKEIENNGSDPSVNQHIIRSLCYSLTLLNEHINTPLGKEVDFSLTTMQSLIITYSNKVKLNFIGHPLSGVQIMGPLEARGIDIKRLIVVGAGENALMKPVAANHIVPAAVRYAYGMPTNDDEKAVAAHNFMRLMSHVEEVWFVFDNRNDNNDGGELSHYVKILNSVLGIKPRSEDDQKYELSVQSQLKQEEITEEHDDIKQAQLISIPKSDDIINALNRFISGAKRQKKLSASSLNTYLNCQLQFYFKYIANIYAKDELDEDVDAARFGNIFHATMQAIYEPYVNKTLSSNDYDKLLQDKNLLEQYVFEAYSHEYHKNSKTIRKPEGQYLVVCHVILNLVIQQLKKDKADAPLTYIGSEKEVDLEWQLADGRKVMLMGKLDRVDTKDDTVRIIDYKTSRITESFTEKYSISKLHLMFSHENDKRPEYGFQALMYSMMLAKCTEKQIQKIIAGKKLQPHIFMVCLQQEMHPGHVSKIVDDYLTSEAQLTKKGPENDKKYSELVSLRQYYEDNFRSLLEEIFNKDIPFTQAAKDSHCRYCDFLNICGRSPRL